MTIRIKIKLDDHLYLRDPDQTDLGKRMLAAAIVLIDAHGFEAFTFKKLAKEIHSTEASIYRYFENKTQLLSYLVAWYWEWLNYRIDYETHHLSDPEQRLKRAIALLASSTGPDTSDETHDLEALSRIVISESGRVYTQPHASEQQAVEEGAFLSYRGLCQTISAFIKEINPQVKHPIALVSTLIETAHRQSFFAKYLPIVTDLPIIGENGEQVAFFLEEMVMGLIKIV